MGAVLDFLKSLSEKLKGAITEEEKIGRPAPKNLKEKHKEKIGRLEARVAKLQKKLKEEEKKKEEHKEKFIEQVESERERVRKRRREKQFPLTQLPAHGYVFSKDHTFIGYFKDYCIGKDGKIGIVVSTEPDGGGTVFIPHSSSSLEKLYHNSDNIHSMLRAGVHILNITEDGKYSPDIDLDVPVEKSKAKSVRSKRGSKRDLGPEDAKRMLKNRIDELYPEGPKNTEYKSLINKMFAEGGS